MLAGNKGQTQNTYIYNVTTFPVENTDNSNSNRSKYQLSRIKLGRIGIG